MFLRIRKPEDLKRLAANELVSDEAYALVKALVEGVYLSSEVDEIEKALFLLEEAVRRVDAERGESWALRARYAKLLSLLKFGMLVKLNEGDVRGLLSADLLFLLAEENDFIQRIQFAVFVWGDENGQRRKSMLSALADNLEPVAGIPVRDWIKDYEGSLSNNQRGALGIESYLSHGSLVSSKTSNNDDKELLRKVLKFYDWLREGGALPGEMVFSELKAERTQRRTFVDGPTSVIPEVERTSQPQEIMRPAAETSIGGPGAREPVSVPPKTERELVEERTFQPSVSPLSRRPFEQEEGGIPSPKPMAPVKVVPPPETLPMVPLQPTPQAMKTVKPAFFFDLEDEREVDKHRERAEGGLTLEQELRRYADEVIRKNNLAFKDDVNKRRFVQLFVSRLKDVRGTVEVREALSKSTETGGLALDADKVEQVIQIMESAKREFSERLAKGEVKPQAESAAPPTAPPPVPLGMSVQPHRPAAPAFDAGKAEEWRQQMLKELQTKAPSSAAPGREAVRPQLMDVKAPPKVVGPLDELMTLSLIDFRRLGATPTEAFHKVRAKMDLIGETSIARRIEAVKAWHMSPVYRQYLTLGRESIEQEKPVAQVIAAHQALGEKVLTEAEFNAVVDFNSKLRF